MKFNLLVYLFIISFISIAYCEEDDNDYINKNNDLWIINSIINKNIDHLPIKRTKTTLDHSIHKNSKKEMFTFKGTVYKSRPESFYTTLFKDLMSVNSTKEFDKVLKNDNFKPMVAPNAHVLLYGKHNIFFTTADENGFFKCLDIVNDKYIVYAYEDNYINNPAIYKNEFRIDNNVNLNLVLDSDRAILQGRVITTEGKPVKGVKVFAQSAPFIVPDAGETLTPDVIAGTTDENGQYELHSLKSQHFLNVYRYMLSGKTSLPGFFAEIGIYKNTVKNKKINVPLITEKSYNRAQLFLECINNMLKRTNGKQLKITKALSYPIPKSKGSIIYVPDIIEGGE